MRPFTDEDGAAVFEYWKSDPGWERFNTSVPSGFTRHDADQFVEEMCARDRSDKPNWALLHDDVVVGVASLIFENDRLVALLGYGVHGGVRGQGLCVEACTEVLNCAFAGYPDLHAIRAHTDAANSASIRVLQKLGFSKDNDSGCQSSESESFNQGETFCLRRAEWEIQSDN